MQEQLEGYVHGWAVICAPCKNDISHFRVAHILRAQDYMDVVGRAGEQFGGYAQLFI